ncbi:MAG: lytic transglycosylase domain-containing protein [Bacillota bacterium]
MRVVFQPETGAQAKKQAQSKKGDFGAVLESTVAVAGRGQGLDRVFASAASRFGLRPELLKAVAQAESDFNPRAVSSAGAQGIMQLMPGTSRSLGVRDPFDPVENIFAGAAYLRSLLDRFGGNETLALAAYNAGPGAVARYGGIPPYRETQAYVNRVLSLSGAQQPSAVEPPFDNMMKSVSNNAEEIPGAETEQNDTGTQEELNVLALTMRYALTEYILQASGSQEEEET